MRLLFFRVARGFNRHGGNRSKESGNAGKGAFRAGRLSAAVIRSKAGIKVYDIRPAAVITLNNDFLHGGMIAELSERFHVRDWIARKDKGTAGGTSTAKLNNLT